MIKHGVRGTVECLKEGRRKYFYVQAEVKNWNTWPFPSDAFPIFRGKARNKKFKEGDLVVFQAVEIKGDLRAWKIKKVDPDAE